MVNREHHPKKFFTREEKDRILRAIRQAEKETSGEIRVYLEHKAKGDPLSRARKVFEKLGMTKTKSRNGVLIYFSLKDHQFAIVGDQGIHNRVGDLFWKEIVSKTEARFLQNDFAGGLEAAIRGIGENLQRYFPRKPGDINELPDGISG